MRRQVVHLALLALALLAGVPLVAQTPDPVPKGESPFLKLDPGLKLYLLEHVSAPRSLGPTPRISLFVEGHEDVRAMVEMLGGSVRTSLGRMVTADMPVDRILDLASRQEIDHLEIARTVVLHNDSALATIGADRAHRGEKPLEHPATGKGVLLGFIDTGIDFLHEEFRSSGDSGASRVVAIWSQVDTFGPKPSGFIYGSEWTRDQIAEAVRLGSRAVVRDTDYFGHGTHVAASAAGLHGVAPDAEIIMVHFHNAFSVLTTDVLDGAAYIYGVADRLGRPCIINASLGTPEQPEDGSDALARGIDLLIDSHPGRFFCASAGNGGRRRTHWGGFNAEPDSLWIGGAHGSYLFRVPEKEIGAFEIDVEASVSDDEGGWRSRRFTKGWKSVASIGESGLGILDTLYTDTGRARVAATMTLAASPIGNGFWSVQLDLNDVTTDSFRVMVRGAGIFHAWSGVFDTTDHSSIDRWRPVDNRYCVASPAVAHNVIGVGSMVNRSSYIALDGKSHPTVPDTTGALSSFSDRGPSTDERTKPDIVAPGQNVISARSSVMWEPNVAKLIGNGHYLVNSGTSMSSPFVAGAIALYLERNPGATVAQVRDAIHRSATRDSWTEQSGPTPNGTWGFGKLNVLGMLEAGATVDRERGAGAVAHGLVITPNPAAGEIRIDVPARGELSIYDPIGRIVHRVRVEGVSCIDLASWPSGLYRCLLIEAEGTSSGGFVVIH